MACSEKIAIKISDWLFEGDDVNELNYLKAKLGIESIIIDVSKAIVVYVAAFAAGTLIPTFVTHLSYMGLRKFSMGLHAKSSFVCTIVSVLMFVGVPYLIEGIVIGRWWIFFAFSMSTWLFWKYAPADTEKAPIIGARRRFNLKLCTIGINSLLMYIALVVLIWEARVLILAGMLMQLVMILPITYKILRRSRNNYEKYETENE